MGVPDPTAPSSSASSVPPAAEPYVHDPESAQGRVLDAVYALQEAEALFRSRLRAVLGLGPNELSAVQLIARIETVGGAAHPSDIARHLGLTSGGASTIVTRLVAHGSVTRHLDPADGRGQVLHLTPAARDGIRQAVGGGELGALGQIVTLSDRESARVVTLLSTVTAGFEGGARPDAPPATPAAGRRTTT